MITMGVLRVLAVLTVSRLRVTARLGDRDGGGRDEGAGMVEWLLIIGFVVVAFTGVAAVVSGLLTRLMGAIR